MPHPGAHLRPTVLDRRRFNDFVTDAWGGQLADPDLP
jgi:hypothetical protein